MCMWAQVPSMSTLVFTCQLYTPASVSVYVCLLEHISNITLNFGTYLVHLVHFIEAFQQLMDSLDADTDETLSDFLAYFESTWLGIVQRGRRRRPKFDVAMWNVYNRVGDNLPRTNNSVEGWHRAFDERMSVTHPTLGRLVSKLRKEQVSTELMMEQLAMGVRMRKNKQYEKVNTRLQALVAMYAQEDV
ncbi:uncharacterized protein LOC112556185 isoform X2 [Pomacea canaliculata]|uniref:uncharacterized protein LOC112556185 isoform X1 n=1 Tax=Pomacea canaliculata TaxID=400727 RepID=UPI000D73A0FE|nr:uncharacterized protein LOC112556185 isoform X1 [Pomacea canaliculata]XP_025080741.1 uncharacterized protein LOC112556185 isoform X2 [Pomacea canaliculata]